MESVSEITRTSKIDVIEEPDTSSTQKRKRSKTDAFEIALGSVVNNWLRLRMKVSRDSWNLRRNI